MQGLPLRAGERREDLVVHAEQPPVQVCEKLLTLGGQRDDRPAPAGAVAAAFNQALVFEAVQDRDQVGGVDAGQLGKHLISRWTPLRRCWRASSSVGRRPVGDREPSSRITVILIPKTLASDPPPRRAQAAASAVSITQRSRRSP